jgi:hypothetical protein
VSVWDSIQQLGGAVGTAGGAIATYVGTQIREIKTSARKVAIARAAVEAALLKMRSELEALEVLKRGIKLEIEQAKHEAASQITRGSGPFIVDPSAPSNGEIARRIDGIERRCEKIEAELIRERGARHALQHQLTEDGREDERQWREIVRDLGEIKGQIQTLR